MKKYTAVINKEEDMFVAECPEVGTVSQGYSIDEAINNLKEATELYLEEFPDKARRKSIIMDFSIRKQPNSVA
ncbi:type II toxin-antitoxin system HicB family antitoxin [uncultured Methanoregula sp.]|uniref:type II toxin-antitoxin system HicB family antitoxin n=1 Tax=uncultured Methanoregula sp. TaxID=1005933 RepID=UPI002AAC1952|nr:type II toxin-antitoxin system HicB family antitoxin [uncultured Methanoregula sp.]